MRCHGWTRVYSAWTKWRVARCRQGTCMGKGLQPRSARCTKGARSTSPPRSRTQHSGRRWQRPLSLRVGDQTWWAPLRVWAGRTRQKEPQRGWERRVWWDEKHWQGGERGPRSLPAHDHRWSASPPVLSTQITCRWSKLGQGTGSILFTNWSLEKTRVLSLWALSLYNAD